jgi:hypothetical protein
LHSQGAMPCKQQSDIPTLPSYSLKKIVLNKNMEGKFARGQKKMIPPLSSFRLMWCSITEQAHPLVWPAHPIVAPPSLRSAGWRISLLRCNIFVWPAHPHCCAAISSAGRRIPIAAPPYHILAGVAAPPNHILAGASHRRADLSYFGQCIQSPRHHCLSRLAHPVAYFGWHIPSPRQPIIFRPAHPIATPPSPILAGASHRLFWPAHLLAAPPSPILAGASHGLFRPAHPIVAPPSLILAGASPHHAAILIFAGILLPRHHRLSLILAGASHRLAALSYLGWHIPSRAANPILAGASHCRATISYLGPHVHSMLRRNFLIQHAPYLLMNQSAWGGGGQSFSAGG